MSSPAVNIQPSVKMRTELLALNSVKYNPMRYSNKFTDIPPEQTKLWGLKLFGLMEMGWDYIDTILDMVVQRKIPELKALTRKMRGWRKDYVKSLRLSVKSNEKLEAIRELIEDELAPEYKKLRFGIDFEMSRLDVIKEDRTYMLGVYDAMATCKAVMAYSDQVDKEIKTFGVWLPPGTFLNNEFKMAYGKLHHYGGDCYNKDLDAMKITVGAICNRLKTLEIPQDILAMDESV